ncbi:hypothetical protein PROFUN_10555 [Planoprotostelium fungivorum]|uniref:F-box domain-containing protein n=1 Tax=Planoprotostelium fungivorum TaxID=1890364 RepID=A0A2P6N6S5_9EUKA|nr:hypothetical protein PROFUN_10555 [Planoprotostelium fungivorum]
MMQQEQHIEEFNWLELAPEVWFNIFEYLDPLSLHQCQSSCQAFHEWATSETLWEKLCRKYYTRRSNWYPSAKDTDEIKVDKTPVNDLPGRLSQVRLTNLLEDSSDDELYEWAELPPGSQMEDVSVQKGWRETFRQLSEIKLDGDCVYWLMRGAVAEDPLSAPIGGILNGTLSLEEEDSYSQVKVMKCRGTGLGGMFQVHCPVMGNFMCISYPQISYTAIPTRTVSIYNQTRHGYASVVWMSEWQTSSGTGVCSKYSMSDESILQVIRQTNIVDTMRDMHRFAGQWILNVHTLGDEPTSYRLKITPYPNSSGFMGRLVVGSSFDQTAVGVIWDDMIAMAFSDPNREEERGQYSIIGQVDEVEGHELYQRFSGYVSQGSTAGTFWAEREKQM